MARLVLIRDGERRELAAAEGETLLSLLQRYGVPLSAPCGGNGKCGKCRVDIIKNGKRETVIACKTLAEDGMTVLVDEKKAEICEGFLLSGGEYAADGEGIGAAVDLGTTTVAIELIERSSGRVLAAASEMNAQRAFGADVISRTQYTAEHEDGLEMLSDCIRGQIARMTDKLCAEAGVETKPELFVAGNTIMQHIMAGISPRSIAVAPYTPETLFDDGAERGGAIFAPCIAGYVGGDITAGMLAVSLHNKKGGSLFVDLGTNGEMALGGREGIVCCSVASGPAFEGAGISCGMASTAGAINHISYENGRFTYSVIGDAEPVGICGSGLIELTACLLRLGIIDGTGYLQGPEELGENFGGILGEDEDENGIVYITQDKGVYFTARDVRQIQLAKAAVAAGIEILLEEAGIGENEVDTLYLAGGFGTYIDVACASELGMLPEALRDRTLSVGNSSLAGAALALCSGGAREELFKLPERCRYVELSRDARFNEYFTEHMMFYEEE